MRVLLVESTPGHGAPVAEWLRAAGHQTATCFEPPVNLACRGVADHASCPLDQPTDVAVLVRDLDGGTRSLTEMGAVCALRRRVPVVEITEPQEAELDSVMLAALAEAAADGTAGYVAAVRAALGRLPSLPAPDMVGVSITRTSARVHVMLDIPRNVPDPSVPMIVDWASRAIREHDQYVPIIDIGVTRRRAA